MLGVGVTSVKLVSTSFVERIEGRAGTELTGV